MLLQDKPRDGNTSNFHCHVKMNHRKLVSRVNLASTSENLSVATKQSTTWSSQNEVLKIHKGQCAMEDVDTTNISNKKIVFHIAEKSSFKKNMIYLIHSTSWLEANRTACVIN